MDRKSSFVRTYARSRGSSNNNKRRLWCYWACACLCVYMTALRYMVVRSLCVCVRMKYVCHECSGWPASAAAAAADNIRQTLMCTNVCLRHPHVCTLRMYVILASDAFRPAVSVFVTASNSVCVRTAYYSVRMNCVNCKQYSALLYGVWYYVRHATNDTVSQKDIVFNVQYFTPSKV